MVIRSESCNKPAAATVAGGSTAADGDLTAVWRVRAVDDAGAADTLRLNQRLRN